MNANAGMTDKAICVTTPERSNEEIDLVYSKYYNV